MTPNIAQAVDQEQRVQNDLVAVEAQIEKETDVYYLGFWDGKDNGKPEKDLWNNLTYRSGWLAGVAKYYDNKYQTSFEEAA